MTLRFVFEAIEDIRKHSSLIEKKKLIKKYVESVEHFTRVVVYSCNQQLKFNIKQLIESNNKIDSEKFDINNIFNYLNELSVKRGATDEDIKKLYFLSSIDDETIEVVRRIVNKDLQCGAGIKLFTEFIDIPVYKGICLCESDYERFFQKECKKDFSNAIWSEKLDGVRATSYDNILYSRSGKELLNFSNAIQEDLFQLNDLIYKKYNKSYSLDGEIIFNDEENKKTFQKLMKNISSLEAKDLKSIQYRIFDILIDNTPFVERYKVLREIFKFYKSDKIKLVEHFNCEFKNISELENFLDTKVKDLNWEGIVLKIKNAPYEYKRSKNWVKVKQWHDDDIEVTGWEYGQNKYDSVVGKLVCKLENGKTLKIGSGFTDEERIDFIDNTPKRIEIRYRDLTDDNIPKHAVFVRTVE